MAERPRRTWLVECYSPGIEEEAVARAGARARAAVDEIGRGEPAIDYLGAFLVAADEVVFHAFAADDEALVEAASRRADLRHERIVESVAVPPPGSSDGPDMPGALMGRCTRRGMP